MSSGTSDEENGSHNVATDITECKVDEGLDSSKNDSEKTEQTAEANVSKDGEISKSSEKNEEVDKNNDSGNEEKPELGEQSNEHEEAGEKPTAGASINNKNVVSREDLKVIFQKFGSVKVSLRSSF